MTASGQPICCRQVVYASEAVGGLGQLDIRRILDVSRYRNRRENVTGCLLYSKRHFVQVIEGGVPQIDELFARIRANPTHRSLRVLVDRSVPRMYGEWSMGYLYSLDLADHVAALHADPSAAHAACVELISAIRPDSVMGPL